MKQTITTRWLTNSNQNHSHFLINFGVYMIILFIIKAEDSHAHWMLILVSPPGIIMWDFEPRIVTKILARNPISFEHMSFFSFFFFFFVFLEATPNHIPLKYRYWIKKSNSIWVVYFRVPLYGRVSQSLLLTAHLYLSVLCVTMRLNYIDYPQLVCVTIRSFTVL